MIRRFRPFWNHVFDHWTCSPLADWLRGTTYPYAAGMEEWDMIRDSARTAHPWRYWLADDGLGYIESVVKWPFRTYYSITCYLRNRFIDKTHYLRTYLPKGGWQDFDRRLLHGMFGGLTDYVERELAAWDSGRGTGRTRGLRHLDWEIGLVEDHDPDSPTHGNPTPQATDAAEVKALYLWWRDERPKRIEPIDLAVDGADGYEEKYGACNVEEARQIAEDTAMMVRLVNIRRSMWT